MTRWYDLHPADETFFATAPVVHRYPVKLPVSPRRVWESIASDESMQAWKALRVPRLTWTSPRPFGVDTTREVVLPLGAMTVRERFFRWDEGKGYSFYVESANRPVLNRFAEDYVIEPDGAGALLTWTIAIEARRGVAALLRLLDPVNKRGFAVVGRAAKQYFATHP
jgi:hypothetical protein